MRSSKERLAYVLRILSAPPLMAVVLFAILYAGKPTAFGLSLLQTMIGG